MLNLSKFAEQLKELMAERELNQTQLANAMGTPRPKLSGYLTARRAPNYESFLSIVDFFHCSADFLFGKSDFPQEELCYQTPPPFSVRLRELLCERGVSQYALVKELPLSWNVLHRWLNGKSAPSLDNLLRLSEYFSCSVDVLLGRLR